MIGVVIVATLDTAAGGAADTLNLQWTPSCPAGFESSWHSRYCRWHRDPPAWCCLWSSGFRIHHTQQFYPIRDATSRIVTFILEHPVRYLKSKSNKTVKHVKIKILYVESFMTFVDIVNLLNNPIIETPNPPIARGATCVYTGRYIMRVHQSHSWCSNSCGQPSPHLFPYILLFVQVMELKNLTAISYLTNWKLKAQFRKF